MYIKGKEILITGGTGSLGSTLVIKLLKEKQIKGIRIYSRDELKQWQFKLRLQKMFGDGLPIAFLIGDVKDEKRLSRAMNGVDCVINTAAMKQVPACEYNPIQAIGTNITGAENVINCAIDNEVIRVLHISTDKAVYPINLYGATKAVAEKCFLHSNVYSPDLTAFSVCRYGNVIASRGSIIPLIREQVKTGIVTLTDKDMTRFFIHLPQVVDFIINRLNDMKGNEIFIPKMASVNILDLMNTFINKSKCKIKNIGIRQGEKIHEILISKEESEYCIKHKDYFTIFNKNNYRTIERKQNKFTYESDNNPEYIHEFDKIKKFIGEEYYD